MKFGSSTIDKVMLGSTEVDAIYVGSTRVWPVSSYTAPDYATSGIQMYYNPEDPNSYSGSGTTLADLSGNGYDATIINAPTFNTSYFTYNGASSQYISSPNMVSSFNNTTAFTVEIWYAPNYTVQGAGGTVLQESGVATPSTNWFYSLIEHRKAPFGSLAYDYAGVWAGGLTSVNPYSTFANNVWRCQTLTYDGTNGRIYTNGTLERTVALTRQEPWNDPNNYGYHLLLGAASVTQQSGAGNNFFTGSIGIVRAYNRALSQSEITQNYNGARAIYGL